MQSHVIDINLNYQNLFNATLKPRTDIDQILKRKGFKIHHILYNHKGSNKFTQNLRYYTNFFKTLIKVAYQKIDTILFQYPFNAPWSDRLFEILVKSLKAKKHILFIHDISSLRFKKTLSQQELNLFSLADQVIVHTEKMKELLLENGFQKEIKVLNLFDYLVKENVNIEAIEPESIVFAGNIAKSEFLRKIDPKLFTQNHLYLYGADAEFNWPENISYEGKFNPDLISNIKGEWGLVWDGDSIETCSGEMGDYLRYNSSHKVSLYIASGKPVIVWSNSGLSDYITKNNLGISVDSLMEIPSKLKSLTSEHKQKIKESISEFQKKLTEGHMTLKSLNLI